MWTFAIFQSEEIKKMWTFSSPQPNNHYIHNHHINVNENDENVEINENDESNESKNHV